jgi:hypothetical protein
MFCNMSISRVEGCTWKHGFHCRREEEEKRISQAQIIPILICLEQKLVFCAFENKTGFLCSWEQNWVFVLLRKTPSHSDRQTATWWKNCKICHHLPYPAVWTCNKKSHEISISLVSRSDMKNHKPFKIFPFLPRLLAAFSDYLSLPERKQKNRHTSPKHSCLYSSSSSFFRCVPALPHAVTNWN